SSFLYRLRPHTRSPLFPYTTLFRSEKTRILFFNKLNILFLYILVKFSYHFNHFRFISINLNKIKKKLCHLTVFIPSTIIKNVFYLPINSKICYESFSKRRFL